MKIKCLILILLFAGNFSNYFAQSWLWAKSAKGKSWDEAISVCTDTKGNVFVTGMFSSYSISFGSITLNNTIPSGSNNIFIAKYDSIGNVLWAKSAGGTTSGEKYGYSVSADPSGNVFVTGWFASPTIAFGSITLVNAVPPAGSNGDIFLAKYDANGNVLWAKSVGGTGWDAGYSVCADKEGNAYVTGVFQGPAISFDSFTFNNSGVFIAKYNSNGNVLWAKSLGKHWDRGNSVSANNDGDVFLSGQFADSITIGSTTLTSLGTNMFIAKYNSNGNALWAKCPEGINCGQLNSVSADTNGNVFVTGWYYDKITFEYFALSSVGGNDAFIVKYDPSGNVMWAKSAGGVYGDEGYSLSADMNGNVFVTGHFTSPIITFDSLSITSPSSNSGGLMFIVKYDQNGNVLCASVLLNGGYVALSGGAHIHGISTDLFGNAYLGGSFEMNPFIIGTETLIPGGVNATNVFVAKYSCCSLNVSISGQDTICLNDSTQLGVIGATNYSWIPSIGMNCNSCANPVVSPNNTTTYTVTGTTSSCSNTATITVTVLPKPTVSVSKNTIICAGENTTLFSSGGISYSWSTGATTPIISVSPSSVTTYSVTVTDDKGCSKDTTIKVLVNPNPIANAGTNISILKCDSASLKASGGKNFIWSTGATDSIISVSPSSTTTYSITVTDINSCSAVTSSTVIVNPNHFADAGTNISIYKGQRITLKATGGTNYVWSTGSTNHEISAMPLETTKYCVTVTNASSCTDTACVVVEISCESIYIPNMFSPNGDGENDVLYVRGVCIKELLFRVFDRWGHKVFETDDISNGWDGTFYGQALNMAVFVYSLKVVRDNGEVYFDKGNITLLR